MVNKKGSMELGVNAIVVLIIALVILGLGIGFVTGLFNRGAENIGGIVDTNFLPVHADASQPIKFEKTKIDMKQGSSTSLIMSVYNTGSYGSNTLSATITTCKSQYNDEFTPEESISLVTVSQEIPVSEEGGYEVILSAQRYDEGCIPNSSSGDIFCKGTYICNVQVSGGTSDTKSAQLIINMIN